MEALRKRLHQIYQNQINSNTIGYGLIGGSRRKPRSQSKSRSRSMKGGTRIGGALREQKMIQRRLAQIEHILGLEKRVNDQERKFYKGATTRFRNANMKAITYAESIKKTKSKSRSKSAKPRKPRARKEKAPTLASVKGITADLLLQGVEPAQVAEDLIDEGMSANKAVEAVEHAAVELQEVAPEILEQIENGDLSGVGLIGGRGHRHRKSHSRMSHKSHSRSHMRGSAARPAKGSAEAKRRMAMVRAHKRM